MEDDWESVADQETIVIRPKVAASNVNKWEGEDDDEDVKESWEDEEEKKDEEKESVTPVPVVVKPKNTKALKAKLADQERLDEEAEELRLANMTSEEKLAEKLRLQKIQEEADLKVALDTFGVTSIGGLDSFNPQTKEEFEEFGSAISWKLSQYKESPLFPQFVEDLVRSICVNLSSADMKKVKISVESLYTEKVKIEKQNAKKPANKSKAKATLRTETDDIDDFKKYGNDYTDDYDDFM